MPKPLADEVRRRAELKGLSTSAFLAELVRAEISDAWPAGYLEETIGCLQDEPLLRAEQGAHEVREPLE